MSLYKTKINPTTGKLQLVPTGTVLVFKAGVANFAALPAVGNTISDARITSDNGHLYVWDGLAWVDQGDIIDIDWSAITGKPTASPANIDDAVTKRHTQNTDTILDDGGANEVSAAEIRTFIDNPPTPIVDAADVTTAVSGVSVQDTLNDLEANKADKLGTFVPISETILLLHGNGTNGDTTIVDEKGHTVVNASGTCNLTTATKQFGTASINFPYNDFIYVNHADMELGTGDFTIDGWFNLEPGQNTGDARPLFNLGAWGSGAYEFGLTRVAGGSYAGSMNWRINGDQGGFALTGVFPQATWFHMAVVRNGNTLTVYKNGVSVGSGDVTGLDLTIGEDLSSHILRIGGWNYDGGGYGMYGKTDEFRIVKGMAIWTDAFTPPVAEYTGEEGATQHVAAVSADGNLSDSLLLVADTSSAINKKHDQGTDQYLDFGGINEVTALDVSDAVSKRHAQNTDSILLNSTLDIYTKLLLPWDDTDGSTTITDATGLHTVTAFGNAQIDTAQSKFGGSSLLLDGTGDYLAAADSADWDFGTGAFTIDFWFRVPSLPGTRGGFIVHEDTDYLNNRFVIQLFSDGTIQFSAISIAGLSLSQYTVTTVSTDTWYHYAVVRNGTSFKGYLNGNQEWSTTAAPAMPNANGSLYVGRGSDGTGTPFYFNGWIEELRVSKGIARWTAAFTPPTAGYALPLIQDGKLQQDLDMNGFDLLNFTGGGAVDSVNTQTGDVVLDASDIATNVSGETVQSALDAKELLSNKSTNTALGTSNTLYPTQNAVKSYVDGLLNANDAMVYKGVINCSGNPNYPAADAGHTYRISVAGKIGGASGINVEVGDIIICIADATASGDQAAVGTYWNIIQVNIDGAVVAVSPFTSTSGNLPKYNNTTGRIIEDSGISASSVSTAVSNSHASGSDNQDASEVLTNESGVTVQDKLDSLNTDVDKALINVLPFIIDGSGATIVTGIKGDIEIPFACTIIGWTALADQSGSIQVDIWKDTYANFAPTDADSITGSSNEVKITSAIKNQDTTLTGWTTSVAAGDILRFNVDSVTSIQRVTISLKLQKI